MYEKREDVKSLSKGAAGRKLLEHAHLSLESKRRQHNHTYSELGTDVDVIMATISKPETLTWSKELAFSSRLPNVNGRVRLDKERSLETIREHVEARLSRYHAVGLGLITTELYSDWYAFIDPNVVQRPVDGGPEVDMPTLAFFATDGDGGISAEISYAWSDGINVKGPNIERTHAHDQLIEGIRAMDATAISNLMTDDVQGTMRAYYGYNDHYIVLDGAQAHQEYYQKLFDAVDILDVSVVQRVVQHYVFCELCWTIRPKTGDWADKTMGMRTADWFVFDADGKISVHGGYGTDIEPTDSIT